jgi:3-hydroxyacyl-[acyl-carrier-protein] dehydratase
MDFEQIRRILPHRFPLIMVDRVIHLEPGSRVVALKNVTGNEFHFMGHFPQFAVMPGVFIIEAAAQTAGLLFAADAQAKHSASSRHYLAGTKMSFHLPVTPGDQMVIEARVLRRLGVFFVAQVKVSVDGAVFTRGELTLAHTSEEAAQHTF